MRADETVRWRRRQVLAAVIVSCGMIVPAAASAAGPDTTMLVSGNASDPAGPVAVSDGGRQVLFSSAASNLDPAADGSAQELFVHDRSSGTTTLVSRGDGPSGAQAASGADEGDISADGRHVVFSSSDRLASDAPSGDHVYLRDVATGATTLVDRASDGSPANGDSRSPQISDDGRRVAFLSDASNLGVTGSAPLLLVRDLSSGETWVAGVDASGAPVQRIEGNSFDFSGDGSHVAFGVTEVTLPSTGGIVLTAEIDARDIDTGSTTLVSRASGSGGPGASFPTWPTISRDGSRVAYTGWGLDLTSGASLPSSAYVSDVGRTTPGLVAADIVGGAPAVKISPDGQHVAFESADTTLVPDAHITKTEVFMRDMTSGAVTLVSRASGAAGEPADADAGVGSFAADGSAFAFGTSADNLVPGAADGQTYLRLIDGDPPRNLTAPAITGEHALLTCNRGTWAEAVRTFSYQWLRDGAVLSGATDPSYAPTAEDVDLPLSCRVVAANRGGETTAESGPAIVLSGGKGGVVELPAPAGQPAPVSPPGPAGRPAQPSAARLAVALAPGRLRVRRNHIATVTYLVTARAKLTLTAARGHAKARVLARKTARKAGHGTVRMRVRLRPGTYRLTVRAQAGARHAGDTISLTVTR